MWHNEPDEGQIYPLTEGRKRNIEAQLDEYEQAIAAARAWMAEWRARQGKPGTAT